MPRLRPIDPPSLAEPRGYSNGMLAPAGGRLLFVAGQIGWDRHGVIVSDRFSEQFRQALANVLAVVAQAGGEPGEVGQLTIYVTDRREYLTELGEVGAAYRALMGRHYPAMALVEVAGLLEPSAKVEIQALAVIAGGDDEPTEGGADS